MFIRSIISDAHSGAITSIYPSTSLVVVAIVLVRSSSFFASLDEAQEGVFHLFHVFKRVLAEWVHGLLAKYLELIFYGL